MLDFLSFYKKNTKYLKKVLRSSSYEELSFIFKNSTEPDKEITESYGCFVNLKNIVSLDNKKIIHIGDGGWARTAAIFTLFSKSINHSIDPELDQKGKVSQWINKYSIRNLYLYPTIFENTSIDEYDIITCVHAHVDLENVDRYYPNWKYLITIPCCNPTQQTFRKKYLKENPNIKLIVETKDNCILSNHNKVYIYEKKY